MFVYYYIKVCVVIYYISEFLQIAFHYDRFHLYKDYNKKEQAKLILFISFCWLITSFAIDLNWLESFCFIHTVSLWTVLLIILLNAVSSRPQISHSILSSLTPSYSFSIIYNLIPVLYSMFEIRNWNFQCYTASIIQF